MSKQPRKLAVPLPPQYIAPRGGKNSTLTPEGYPALANKFTVRMDSDKDLVLYYKGSTAGVLSWHGVLELGVDRVKKHLRKQYSRSDGAVGVKIQSTAVRDGWQFIASLGKRGETGVVWEKVAVYHASEMILLAWGVGQTPGKFAFPQRLSHNSKQDLRGAASYALRRGINYIIWQLDEARQRARVEEALSNSGKTKRPA